MKIWISILFLIPYFCFSQKLKYENSFKLPSEIKESSGLVKASDSSFYTINDSGNSPILFEINKKGKLIRKIQIEAKNYDWEDLAKDENGNIYIADIGNNLNKRQNLRILKIREEDLSKSSIKPIIFEVKYPDQKAFPPEKSKLYYDCEALVVKGDFAYIFTKNRTEPFDGLSKVYRISLATGKTSTVEWNTLQLCKDGWYPCSVTSASYDHKSGTLVLLTYTKIYYFENFNFEKNGVSTYQQIKLGKIEQFEAIYLIDSNKLILTSEEQKIIGGGKIHLAEILFK